MNPSRDLNDPLMRTLRTAHDEVTSRHAATREELLERLSEARVHRPPRAWLGSVGVGAMAASVIFVIWMLTPNPASVAMERLVNALEDIHSYTYRMEAVSRQEAGRTVRQISEGRWRTTPYGLYATMRITENFEQVADEPKLLVDLVESHQAGQRGIILDHLRREYWWIDEQLDANAMGNPLVAIYMVREQRGRVVRDLGKKKIGTQLVHGIELILDKKLPTSDLGLRDSEGQDDAWWEDATIEVWIDTQTNLPREVHCKAGDTIHHYTDLVWDAELTDDDFFLAPPSGYREVFPSNEEP